MSNKYPGSIITSGANAGYSVAFDGTGDYLSIANNTALDLTGDFTIECWVYLTNVSPGYNPTIVARWGASGGQIYTFQVLAGGTFRFITSAGTWTGGSVSANTWTHLAVSRSGSSLRLFNAGALSSTNTDSTSLSGTQVTSIGGESNGAQSVPGYVSNVRIVKGTALYTAAFTPPTQLFNVPGTSLLTCNSPAIIDQSPNAFAITVNGNAAASTFTPFTGYTAYNPALGASTPGVWTVSEALEARQTRRWNMYDPYFNLTTLLLHGNGTNGAQNNTFLDSSSNNFTITRNGNTTQGTFTPFSQSGWSNNFASSSTDMLSTASNAAFAFGTGDFTMEAFVFATASQTDNWIIGLANNCWLRVGSGGALEFYNSVAASSIIAGSAMPINQWVHVAAVRSGTTLTIYQNGISVASGTVSTNFSTSVACTIGNQSGVDRRWNGYLSNVRVVKGTAVYTSAFTPPTSALTAITNTSLLTCQNNRFIDNSANAFSLTVGGTPSVQAFSPFYPVVAYTPQAQGGSGYFDGTGDYLSMSDNASFNIGANAFAIELWYYAQATAAERRLISQWDTGNKGIILTTENQTPRFYYSLDGTSDNSITSSATPAINQWNHLAVCRSGSTLSMFLNGARVATTTQSGTFFNATGGITIGSGISGATPMNGYIAAMRSVIGSSPYDATQSTITIPTTPPTAITNTQLLLNFTNAGIIDSTGDNVLETVGNAQISTTQSKFGGSSMYFDGTVDYLTAATNPAFLFNTGDFTVELWYYPTALTGTPGLAQALVGMWGPSSSNASWLFYLNAGNLYWYTSTNGSTQTATMNAASGMSAGSWYHLALCRSGGTTRIFVNGSSIVSTTTSVNLYNATCPLTVGYNPIGGTPDYVYGYIDELRITKGVARYTGNFTPQTSQWQDQ